MTVLSMVRRVLEASHDTSPYQSMDQKVGLPYPKNRLFIVLIEQGLICNNIILV